MFSALVAIGQTLTAAQINAMRKDSALFSGQKTFTYDSQGRLATIVDNDLAITLTITYSSTYPNQVSSTTDGTKTWTFNYNSKRQLTSITEA